MTDMREAFKKWFGEWIDNQTPDDDILAAFKAGAEWARTRAKIDLLTGSEAKAEYNPGVVLPSGDDRMEPLGSPFQEIWDVNFAKLIEEDPTPHVVQPPAPTTSLQKTHESPASSSADSPELNEALCKAQAAFDALSPEERAAHRQAQKENWTRAEMQMDRKPAPSPAVKVKPLEWSATGTWTRSDIGEYAIAQIGRTFFLDFGGNIKKAIRGNALSSHPNLSSAQAAAQADYEHRVLSSLEPAPAKGRDEPVAFATEKAVEKLKLGSPTSVEPRRDPAYSVVIPLYLHPSDAYARGAEDMREKSAWTATSFLVGDPTNGVPLRSPGPHEIAKAIRALPLTEGEKK